LFHPERIPDIFRFDTLLLTKNCRVPFGVLPDFVFLDGEMMMMRLLVFTLTIMLPEQLFQFAALTFFQITN